MAVFKQRVRQLTRRSGGRSLEEVVRKLRLYVLEWKAYFRLADTPGVWSDLDKWIGHRMRAIQLKHWKRGSTIHRELLARGAPEHVAAQVAVMPSMVAQQRDAPELSAESGLGRPTGIPRLR